MKKTATWWAIASWYAATVGSIAVQVPLAAVATVPAAVKPLASSAA
jgi:hypothetical protein